MKDTVSVLGVLVDRGDMDKAVSLAVRFIEKGGVIYTPNPEIIMKAYRDKDYMNVLNRADMIIPDGIGVVIAAKILKKPVAERVTGYDLVCNMIKYAAKNNISLYIFGGKAGVAKKAAEKIEAEYGARVCGTEHGYHQDTSFVIDDITKKKPGIVLVCLGAPHQEKWIDQNRDKLHQCLIIGAGGSVDVLAGEAKRAPGLFIRLNLEWFYRLLKQPARFIRMLELPRFALTVFFKGERQNEKKRN